jgi:hypothetical protein
MNLPDSECFVEIATLEIAWVLEHRRQKVDRSDVLDDKKWEDAISSKKAQEVSLERDELSFRQMTLDSML